MSNTLNLDCRGGVAVVTGAASGIGAAVAALLSQRGCDLALVDVDAERLAATATQARERGVRVTTHVVDLAVPQSAQVLHDAVRDGHGRASILVNNAGVALGGDFAQVTPEDFDWLMAVNFGAVVRLVRTFLPMLARERAAQIVNVSSIYGIVAPPGQTAYCASKFAVRGFSEALRHELQRSGSPVGLTLVHPGGVRTRIADNARLAPGMSAEQIAQGRLRMQRLLTLPPEAAAQRIVLGIERREPRVLVGADAVAASWVQRVWPVSYWRHLSRSIERRLAAQNLQARA